MNPQGPGQPQQPHYPPNSSPNGVPPIPNNPWQQAQPTQPTQPQMQQQQPTPQPPNPWPQAQPTTQFQQQPQMQQQPTQAPQPNYNAPEYSIDYLNQIAPKQQKAVSRFAVFALIGVVIISAIFAVVALLNSQGPSVNERLAPVNHRITSLQKIASTQQKVLSENQISEANAVLNSSLTSMSANLTAIMKERGVKNTAPSTEKAYAAELTKILEDSYQKGTLDRTYTAQMTYELTLLKSKITAIKKQTSNKSLLEFCNSSIDSLDIVLEAYTSFNATKS